MPSVSASPRPADSFAALRFESFRWWAAASIAANLGSRALAVVIGFQVYAVTHSTLALGLLGLVEAIPALGLALLGGHFADRRDRRRIVLVTRAVSVFTAAGMALASGLPAAGALPVLYALVFAAGIARGFGDPASSALETQLVPSAVFVNAAAWMATAWQGSAIIGPALGGVLFELVGGRTYWLVAGFFALSTLAAAFTRPPVAPLTPVARTEVARTEAEPMWASISAGLRFVRADGAILGSMALDLFAVLFGGAVALLPVFAADILHVGARGLGLLLAAPSVGALAVMLFSTRRPPARGAGRLLLTAVAGFGVSIIVFALSRNLWLSTLALGFSGAFDGFSVIIRRSILRLRTPNHLRGRVAAVSLVFIGSSNEIGAFESGVAATLLGAVPSVWLGGLATLVVVAVTAWRAPQLRELDLTQAVE